LKVEAEEWRTIPEFENYEVSESGKVRRRLPGNRTRPGRPKKLQINNWGYSVVNLQQDGKRYAAKVHSLVTAAFIGPQPLGHDVHHKDLDKTKNHYTNLEYVQSCLHEKHPGERNPNASLTEAKVLQIRQMRKDGWKYSELAKYFGINKDTVRKIVKGKRWGHLPL
jgi:DNA-binding transcriptional regulator YiaG